MSIDSIFPVDDYTCLRNYTSKLAEMYEAKLAARLHDLASIIDRIENRAKSFESIKNNYLKYVGTPSEYIGIQQFIEDTKTRDLIGLRVVVFYDGDVDTICENLLSFSQETFPDSKQTIRDTGRGSKFGYRAEHIRFVHEESDLEPRFGLDKVWVEIQVRTLFSDVWARHSHKLSYKGLHETPNAEIERAFAIASAQLEGLDKQIEALKYIPSNSERAKMEVVLSWSEKCVAFIERVQGNLTADQLRAILDRATSMGGNTEISEDSFFDDLHGAYDKFGSCQFEKYNLGETSNQIAIMLYGFNQDRYEHIIPTYLKPKAKDITDIHS